MSGVLVPFRLGRFEDLPELPVRPHPYFESERRKVVLRSPHFGVVECAVRVSGVGPPLLLVHGLMTSSYSWRYVLEPLGRHHTLYVPDLLGSGESDLPTGMSYSARATADLLGALMEELGILGCPVVGNSMGGYLCMQLALRRPEAMSALVNLHAPGFPEARLFALHAALSLPGAGSLLDGMIRRDPLRWAHRNVHYRDEGLKSLEEARVYGAPLATPEGRASFASILKDTMDPFEMWTFQRELLARRAAGQRFPVPLCLLWARADPMVPPRFGPKYAARIPSAELVYVEDASHFAHVDQPEACAAAILGFLHAPR